MTDAPARQFRQGTLIGQYRIEREVGRGAMGVVYLAIERNLERPVALKILNESLSRDSEFVSRFFNEARAAASLSHPNIIQVYAAGVEEPGIYYFAMEYVEGETLLDRVQRDGCLSVADTLQTGIDLAEALDYGWKKQALVHGDLKPENIIVSVRGETKLADFGLAKVIGHDFAGDGIMLTPLYAAPERIEGKVQRGDCRPDIYSFGATLYHLLAGQPPFPGTDTQKVLHRHLHEPPFPLNRKNRKVPRELAEFVGMLLAKAPDKRPQTWEHVANALKLFQSRRARKVVTFSQAGMRTGAGPGQWGAAPDKSSVGILLAVLFLAVLVLLPVGWLLLQRYIEPPAAGALTENQRDALVEWQAFRDTRLARETNIYRRFSMLEKYRSAHPDWVPPECDEYLRACREKLALPPREAPVPRAEKPNPAPAPTPPIPPPPEDTPAPPSPTPPEKAPTGEVGKPEPLAPLEKAPELPSREGLAVDRADAGAEFFAEVSAQFKALPKTLEPLMQKGKGWLDEYKEPSEERQQVSFLMKTVFPAFDEFFPSLLLRKEALIGKVILFRKGERKPVKDLTMNELVLLNKTDYGEVNLRVPWNDLDRLSVYTVLGKAACEDTNLTPDERRPFLAFLLLTRQFELFAEQCETLPDSEQKRLWLILRDQLNRADPEGKALQTWREATRTAQHGGLRQTWRLLRELKAAPSAVAFRHAAEIDTLFRLCASRVPEELAPALVQKAQEISSAQPREALALLNCAALRYGRLDFPEKRDIERLRLKVLELLQGEEPDGRPGERPGDRLWRFLPSVNALPQAFPGASYLTLHALEKEDLLPQAMRSMLPQLYGLTWLEMGDWDAARRAFLDRGTPPPPELPRQLQGALVFGKAVTASRFSDGGILSDPVLAKFAELSRPPAGELPRLPDDPWLMLLHSQLAVEFLFVNQDWKQTAPPWPDLDALATGGKQMHLRAPLLLAILAWNLEAGKRGAVSEFLDTVKIDAEGSPYEQKLVQPLRGFLTGASDWLALPATNLGERPRECYTRLLLSLYLSRPRPLPPARDAEFRERLHALNPRDGWLAASTWFDLLLLRTTAAVGEKNYPAALEYIQRTLAEQSAYAGQYYPRIRFLQAGMELLSGNLEQAQETLETVGLSTVASPAEQAIGGMISKKTDGIVAVAAPEGNSPEVLFWGGWLRWAHATKSGAADAARQAAADMKRGARSLAQKHMVGTLAPGVAGTEVEIR